MLVSALNSVFSIKIVWNNIFSTTQAEGVPGDQWVKRWPTDLAVPGSSPAQGEIFLTAAHSLPFSCFHRPAITEILLKRTHIASFINQILHTLFSHQDLNNCERARQVQCSTVLQTRGIQRYFSYFSGENML